MNNRKISHAREHRTSCTVSEGLLWSILRARQVCDLKFRREHSIGGFIVDFACEAMKLVVEVDGGYHDQTGEHGRDLKIGSERFQVIASAAAPDDLRQASMDVGLPPGAEPRLLGVLARLMPPKRGPLDITFLRRVTSDEHHLVSITLDRRGRERVEAQLENPGPTRSLHATRQGRNDTVGAEMQSD